ADQGGSTADQLKAASLTVAMGAVPMLAESGASSLPLRIAERGAKSGALAIPASALISNLQNPSRRTTAGFTADDVISAIPQIITGALTGGRELPFRGTVGGRPSVVNPALRNTNASAAGDAFLDRMRAALDRDAARRANNVTPPGAESSPANPYRNANGSLRIPERASSRTDPNLASYEAKMKRIADDAQLADAAYDRVPDTFGGKVIGTDLARELLDEYAAGRDGRIKYVNATGRVAQAYAKDRLWREITHPGGRDLLTFTAGGVAAGKSTALTKATVGNADLVFDGTLRETKWAIDTIELARANGWKVEIYYVQRPMPLVIQGAIDRAQREGRWGAIADLPKIHRAAQESILKIADALKSDPGVQIQYWLNAGTPEYPMPAKAIDRAEIDPEGEYSYAEITDDQGRANRTSTPKNAQRVQRGFPAYWQGEVERAVESERVESPEAGQAYPGSFSAYWQREVEQAFRRAVESGKYDPEILAGLAQGSPELESILHSAREVPGGLDRMRAALDADAAREEKSVHASGAGSSSSDDGIASGTAIGDLVHFEPIPSHELPLAEALRIEALARAVRKSKENSGNDPAGERIVFQANRALGDRFRGGRGAAALRFIEDFGRLTGTRVVFVDSNEGTPFFSGAVDPRDPNAIFIHVRGKRPIDALLGHEWGHTLQRQDPALYRSLQRIAFRYTGDWRLRARTFRA
ncbi:MAG TPA: zeta toxin family protein, partial [Chthoniobacterales bacterium]